MSFIHAVGTESSEDMLDDFSVGFYELVIRKNRTTSFEFIYRKIYSSWIEAVNKKDHVAKVRASLVALCFMAPDDVDIKTHADVFQRFANEEFSNSNAWMGSPHLADMAILYANRRIYALSSSCAKNMILVEHISSAIVKNNERVLFFLLLRLQRSISHFSFLRFWKAAEEVL